MAADTWTQLTVMPVPTGSSSIGAEAGVIYSVGGISPPGGGTVETRVRGYTIATDAWAALTSLPLGVFNQVVAGDNGAVFSVGGIDATFTRTAVVRRYDVAGNSWSTVASLPAARSDACGAFIGGILYIAGGVDAGGSALSSLVAYDPGSNTWSTLTAMPFAFSASGAAVLDGKLHVIGGTSNRHYQYDPATDTWTSLASAPGGADNVVGCGAANGYVVAVYSTSGAPTTMLTRLYSPASNSWLTGATIPHAPQNQAGACSPSADPYVYVVGGVVGGYNQRYEALPAPGGCVTDSFDRADTASTLGSADTGQIWVEVDQFNLGGTWGISSNQAYMPSSQAGAPLIAALTPSGFTTGYTVTQTFAVQHDIPSAQGFPTLIFAADSTSPATSAWYQIQNDGGGHAILTALRGFAGSGVGISLGFDIASGDVIAVDVYDSAPVAAGDLGKTIRVSRNGTVVLTHVANSADWGALTPTTFGQYHGFSSQSRSSNPERVDDFAVCPLSLGGVSVGRIRIG